MSRTKVSIRPSIPQTVIFLIALASTGTMSDRANALERTTVSALRCAGAMDAIRKDSAIIVRRPSERISGLTLFDRYVIGASACDASEIAILQDVKTIDDPTCRLFVCRPSQMGHH